MKRIIPFFGLLLPHLLAMGGMAQSPPAERFSVFESGVVGVSQGGRFVLAGRVGPIESVGSSGGVYSLSDPFTIEPGITPTLPPPRLVGQYDAAGGNLILSWPDSATDYVLEVCTDLDAAAWSPMSASAQVAGGAFHLTLRPQMQRQFFRLSKSSGP